MHQPKRTQRTQNEMHLTAIEQIQELHALGLSDRKIAEDIMAAHRTIGKLRRGETTTPTRRLCRDIAAYYARKKAELK